MNTALMKIIEDCLDRIQKGETVESCLERYPRERAELEPLLSLAFSVSSLPRVTPSAEFVESTRARLMDRIRAGQVRQTEKGRRAVDMAAGSFWWRLGKVGRVAVPVMLALALVVFTALYQFGGLRLGSPPTAMASPGILNILNGDVQVKESGSDVWNAGEDGMAVSVGTTVRTGAGSNALITFLEGSTVRLEPGTTVEIERVTWEGEEPDVVVLQQDNGRTWSRVDRELTGGAYYMIKTPTATAVAKGTLFSTEVGDDGETNVITRQGVVSVSGRGKEVDVVAFQRTSVPAGGVPSVPADVPDSATEIVVLTDRQAEGSITDPSGASTGKMPDGSGYNQITGSSVFDTGNGGHYISVTDPVGGRYVVVLRYHTPGTTHIIVRVLSGGKTVSEYSGWLLTTEQKEWLVHLDLDVEDGQVTDASISRFEPLGPDIPEKGVGAGVEMEDGDDRDGKQSRGQPRGGESRGDTRSSEDTDKPDQDSPAGGDEAGPRKGQSQPGDNRPPTGQGEETAPRPAGGINEDRGQTKGEDNQGQGQKPGQGQGQGGSDKGQDNGGQGKDKDKDNNGKANPRSTDNKTGGQRSDNRGSKDTED